MALERSNSCFSPSNAAFHGVPLQIVGRRFPRRPASSPVPLRQTDGVRWWLVDRFRSVSSSALLALLCARSLPCPASHSCVDAPEMSFQHSTALPASFSLSAATTTTLRVAARRYKTLHLVTHPQHAAPAYGTGSRVPGCPATFEFLHLLASATCAERASAESGCRCRCGRSRKTAPSEKPARVYYTIATSLSFAATAF